MGNSVYFYFLREEVWPKAIRTAAILSIISWFLCRCGVWSYRIEKGLRLCKLSGLVHGHRILLETIEASRVYLKPSRFLISRGIKYQTILFHQRLLTIQVFPNPRPKLNSSDDECQDI